MKGRRLFKYQAARWLCWLVFKLCRVDYKDARGLEAIFMAVAEYREGLERGK